jgi:hypothetical protein
MTGDSREKWKWRDHPIVVAAGSAAAALVFAQTVIFPTLTASLQNDVSSLRSQVQEISALKDRLKKVEEDAKVEKQKMEADAKIEKEKLIAAQMSNLFSLGSPYPVGFGKVKTGDSIDVIVKEYPEASIDRRSAEYWSVKHEHPAFRSVSHFFDRPKELKDRRVRAMLFHGHTTISGILQDKLIEALGQPGSPGPKADCFLWTVDKSLFVKKDSPSSFAILSVQSDCKIPEK